jgi:5-methylcytosine-specific restriction endonuclease McrA
VKQTYLLLGEGPLMHIWDKVQREAFTQKTKQFRGITRFTGPTHRWRQLVLARDNYQCVICFSTKDLEAHHVERWIDNPIKRLKKENGITLCKKCHHLGHGGTGKAFTVNQLLNKRSGKTSTFLIKKRI